VEIFKTFLLNELLGGCQWLGICTDGSSRVDACRCCGICMEMIDHLYKCEEAGMKELWTLAKAKLELSLYQIGISPQIIPLLVKAIDPNSNIFCFWQSDALGRNGQCGFPVIRMEMPSHSIQT